MPPRKRRKTSELATASSKAIAVLSSSLVLRGLREFPHSPGWRVKQAFQGIRQCLSISPRGYVATFGEEGHAGSRRLEIYDLELSWLPTLIEIPSESNSGDGPARASVGWAPSGRTLLATNSHWTPEFHLIDAYAGHFQCRFGNFQFVPEFLSWSGSEKFCAACSDGSENGTLQLWECGAIPDQFQLLREVQARAFDKKLEGEDLGDQGKLWGFGCAAFHPREKLIAAVLEYEGEWSDDSILILRVPTLDEISRFNATGQITGVSWSRDGQQLFFCASGQAYVRNADGGDITSLPFAAELCRCHPSQPLCAFYNSLLKNTAKGRVFVADLRTMNVLDECSAEGILDIQWSADGRVLYAVAQDGSAYLYEHQQA
jgi:WD40 repeat protein